MVLYSVSLFRRSELVALQVGIFAPPQILCLVRETAVYVPRSKSDQDCRADTKWPPTAVGPYGVRSWRSMYNSKLRNPRLASVVRSRQRDRLQELLTRGAARHDRPVASYLPGFRPFPASWVRHGGKLKRCFRSRQSPSRPCTGKPSVASLHHPSTDTERAADRVI